MAAPIEHFFERTSVRWTLGALVGFVLLTALWLALTLTADAPRRYANIEDHYKYGSIGSEPGVSLLRPVGGVLPPRSEERRVGKECRSRWSPYH